ncbi:MAG: acetoin utilization protein AcuC [Gammaproteobacteria bacterium]|nr:acetoin utilization protein AcuC [Gammaproteobacteria bacterium]
MRLQLYYGADLARYGFGGGHPFGTDRLDAFWQQCVSGGLRERVDIAMPVLATESELLRFHTSDYVARVRRLSESGNGYLDSGDTPAFPGVFEAASYVVGSTLDAVNRVVAGGVRGFVPIAGLHHARRDSAAGFCVFNDVGVAIETLREIHHIRRIAYIDIDAHHGDGVFYAYESDPDLLIADVHEDGRYLYPGTGAESETGTGDAVGTKINIPMKPGADDADFWRAWPRVEEFLRNGQPQFILFQAGADSLAGDPLTHLSYSAAVHGYVATRLRLLADECCGGRLVAMGGGGYDHGNLARAWTAVAEAMIG